MKLPKERIACFLAAATVALAGCAGDVVTNPDAVAFEPPATARLRAPQTVALRNAFDTAAMHEIKSDSGTWVVDLRQITETAVVGLRRTLEKQGISAAQKSAKNVTLRLEVRGAWTQVMPGHVIAKANLGLEARFGDGSAALVEAENGSAFGATRAFEGAIRVALQRLLFDPAFIAFFNG